VNLTLSGGGGNYTVELGGKALTSGASPNKALVWISPGRTALDLNNISGLKTLIAVGGSSAAPNTVITGITVPEGVTALPNNFAAYCANLQTVTLPSTLTTIGGNAFLGCHADLTFSGGCAELGGKVLVTGAAPNKTLYWISPGFTGNLDLASISGLKTVGVIGSDTSPLPGVTGMTIPEGVTELPMYFARYCPNLASVTLPSTLTSILNFAFMGTKLTSVTIPVGVTTLWHSAFNGCAQLQEVICLNPTPVPNSTMGNTVFDGCHASLQIKVPADSVAAYKSASKWSVYASKIVAIE
jgi:hypothetical protein